MLPQGGREAGVDWSVRVYRHPWFARALGAAYIFLGSVCVAISLFLQPDRPIKLPGFVGLIWMVAGFAMIRADTELACEISERGIVAPEGFWHRATF